MKTPMAFLFLTASSSSQLSPDACIMLAQSAEASAKAINTVVGQGALKKLQRNKAQLYR